MAQTGPSAGGKDGRPATWYLLAAGFVAGGVLFGVWIALVGQADLQDNVAGLAVTAAALAAGWQISARGRAVPQFHRRDLARLARLGPEVVTQTAGVYAATWRRARGRGAPSGVRSIPTDAGGGGWRAARRIGVVTAMLSFAPATVVIDVDAETGVATVHDFGVTSDRSRP